MEITTSKKKYTFAKRQGETLYFLPCLAKTKIEDTVIWLFCFRRTVSTLIIEMLKQEDTDNETNECTTLAKDHSS